jgi:chaperonin GroES
MSLKPLNAHVLVRPLESENATPGGLILPDSVEQDRREGEVVALAEDATEETAVGDRIIYKDLSAAKVHVDGEELLLVSSDDILLKYVSADAIPN